MSEQSLTPEQITTLLTELFVNQNNLDKTYYDMFYNPIPMDITLQRYDENNVLQTVTIPNRAKDKESTGLVKTDVVTPNGNVAGNTGDLYLNTASGKLYYKRQGANNSVEGWVELPAPDVYGGAYPVSIGGTGVKTLSGIVRGNGTAPFSPASEFMGNPSSIDSTLTNANYNADYCNPYSVASIVSNHNLNNTSHADIRTLIFNEASARASADSNINNIIKTYLYDTSTSTYKFPILSFPQYSNYISYYKHNLLSANTAPSDGWIMAYFQFGGTGDIAAQTANIVINGVNYRYDTQRQAGGMTSSFILVPVAKGTTHMIFISQINNSAYSRTTDGRPVNNESYYRFLPCTILEG